MFRVHRVLRINVLWTNISLALLIFIENFPRNYIIHLPIHTLYPFSPYIQLVFCSEHFLSSLTVHHISLWYFISLILQILMKHCRLILDLRFCSSFRSLKTSFLLLLVSCYHSLGVHLTFAATQMVEPRNH